MYLQWFEFVTTSNKISWWTSPYNQSTKQSQSAHHSTTDQPNIITNVNM